MACFVTSSNLFNYFTVKGAYRDATSLVNFFWKWKEDTQSTSFPDESLRDLRRSLVSGHSVIEAHYRHDFARFGKGYARGDSRARDQMENILITLQSTILSTLQQVEHKAVPSLDYEALLSASDNNRAEAAACLGALSRRLSVAAAAVENDVLPEHNMPYPMGSDWMPETLSYSDGWPGVGSRSLGDWGPSSSTHENHPHYGNASSTVPKMSVVTEEPENGGISDIDMDRFSTMSLAPSSLSGFSSLRSLARRIRSRQTDNLSLDRYSMDDLPSSAIKWNRSSSSLEVFGQLSSRLSIASSQKTDGSQMSWRPEIPVTIEEDDAVIAEGLLARFRWPKNRNLYTPEEEQVFMKAMSEPLRSKPDNSPTNQTPGIPATTQEDGEVAVGGLLTRLRRPKSVQTSTPARLLHIEHVTHERTKGQVSSALILP